MHLLVLLVAVVLIAIIAYQLGARRDAPAAPGARDWGAAAPRKSADHALAFISRGKLFYRTPGQEPREVQSPYVQTVMDRIERSRQLHGWKDGTALSMSFTGRERRQKSEVSIQATSAAITRDGRMLYFLRDDSFGGLFEQDLDTGTEKRLLHKQNLSLEDLCLSADGQKLLCAQHSQTGTANIASMNADGSEYVEFTGGDTVDTAPAWVPGDPTQVLFQSTGIARDSHGMVIAHGPASIQMASIAKGSLTPILDDPQWDYLQPRVGANGSLYFIRRPYEGTSYSTRNALSDALLFPFRLLRALFHYLNFFSLMYSRKPLTTASGPMIQSDLKDILLKGKRFDAEAALRSGVRLNGVPSLVPASWQLVSRNQRGEEQVLATHVASFDIAANGDIVFSNGYGVFALDGANPPHVLLRDKLIADVIVGSAPH